MAEAFKKTKEVVLTTTTIVPDGITLHLSQEEARFVFDMTGNVAGSPDHSRRKHADAIRQALHDGGGIKNYGSEDLEGTIRMRSTSPG